MGRRNSLLGSIVSDIVQICIKLPWWGALAFGFISYLILAIFLAQHFQNSIDSLSDDQFGLVFSVKLSWLVRASVWGGNACLVAAFIIAFLKVIFEASPDRKEGRLIAFLSKLLGRAID